MLMVRIRNGESAAQDLLIKANLRFVVGVCRNYQHQGLPLSDLINEGNLGLIRASKHFDETKNFKFISYAVWWIRQGILSALSAQSRIVRLPINRSGELYKVGRIRCKLEQQYQRAPMNIEIAAEMGMKEQRVNDTLSVGDSHVSLDAPVGENSSTGLIDLLQDEDPEQPDRNIAEKSLRKVIEKALGTLPPREKEIIKLYFGIGKNGPSTLNSIALRFQLTRERIRQIKEKAIMRLKKNTMLEYLENNGY
jgi:RNA polymerase primary sigma factor